MNPKSVSNQIRTPYSRWRSALQLLLPLIGTMIGCDALRYYNTQSAITRKPPSHHQPAWWCCIKNCYFYPIRDLVSGIALAEALHARKAWNLGPQGHVPDGSFYQHRNLAGIEPERFLAGPWDEPAPIGPLTVVRRKSGSTPGFVGQDGDGKKWLFKLDAPDWPELGTAAEAIGARVAWAMGYHVPATYIITIEGTGISEYDGRRAVAVRYIPGKILGHWKFDWFRYRREIRALRLVCMWINDIDHGDNNTLISWDGKRATYWLIDFNSSLGAWQGKPKTPSMGWLHVWDPQWQLAALLSLGLMRPGFDPNEQVVSPAVGRFDSLIEVQQWRPRQPNPAFSRLTDADARWMIREMHGLSNEQLTAIVRAGRYSNPADELYVLRTLRERRNAIFKAYGAVPKVE